MKFFPTLLVSLIALAPLGVSAQTTHHSNQSNSFVEVTPVDPNDGWSTTHEVQTVGRSFTRLEAEEMLPFVENSLTTLEALKSLAETGNTQPIVTLFSSGFDVTYSSQALAEYIDLFESDMIPESNAESILKAAFIAVAEAHETGSLTALAQALIPHLGSMDGNALLAEELTIVIDELQGLKTTLEYGVVGQSSDNDENLGVIVFMPYVGLNNVERSAQARSGRVKKHGCAKYGWWPFYPAPPLKKTFMCGSNGDTLAICGGPADGCRRCDGEENCMNCCSYFGATGGLCERNCGDANIQIND